MPVMEDMTIFVCPPQCDHQWDGKEIEYENITSVTCSKCGLPFIDFCIMRGD